MAVIRTRSTSIIDSLKAGSFMDIDSKPAKIVANEGSFVDFEVSEAKAKYLLETKLGFELVSPASMVINVRTYGGGMANEIVASVVADAIVADDRFVGKSVEELQEICKAERISFKSAWDQARLIKELVKNLPKE